MKKYLLLALAPLLLLGCATSNPWPMNVTGPGVDEVNVLDVRATREGERLHFQVTLQNDDDDDPLRLRYRVTWLDSNFIAVGQDTAISDWRVLNFAPGERRFITGTAPTAACATFDVYLQEIDD